MKSSEHITREQLDKVADILELGRIKYSGTNATMRCPLCRNKNHTFIVDISSGKYRCNHCRDIGNVENLGITICATIFEIEEFVYKTFSKPVSADNGIAILLPFENKNFNEVIALSQTRPSIIVKHKDNENDFGFIYYFSNLHLNTTHYDIVFYKLYIEFKDLIAKRVPSDLELLTQYTPICANNVYYRVIDYYTDEQLNALIELFD